MPVPYYLLTLTALSFAYKHWDLKNPFAKIEPPLHKEPQIRYLLLSDIRRLLDYLKVRQQGYGSAHYCARDESSPPQRFHSKASLSASAVCRVCS